MRIALAGNTPSSVAVLRSLLALSSLHRYGIQVQAIELKISSLNALAAASMSNFGAKEVIQHVAAGMLLCSFEVSIPFAVTSMICLPRTQLGSPVILHLEPVDVVHLWNQGSSPRYLSQQASP